MDVIVWVLGGLLLLVLLGVAVVAVALGWPLIVGWWAMRFMSEPPGKDRHD